MDNLCTFGCAAQFAGCLVADRIRGMLSMINFFFIRTDLVNVVEWNLFSPSFRSYSSSAMISK